MSSGPISPARSARAGARCPRNLRKQAATTRRGNATKVRRTPLARRASLQPTDEDPQHAAQRLGRAPQQLVADGERAEVVAAHRELAQPADRDLQRARSRRPASARARCSPRCVLGTTRTHSLPAASIDSISASGTSRVSLMVSAWLWQRIAPMRTQIESTAIAVCRRLSRPRILLRLGAALPFLAAHAVAEVLVDPGHQAARRAGRRSAPSESPRRAGCRRPRGRCRESPKPDRRAASRAAMCASPICASSSRMFCAPAPDAAW